MLIHTFDVSESHAHIWNSLFTAAAVWPWVLHSDVINLCCFKIDLDTCLQNSLPWKVSDSFYIDIYDINF